MELKPEQTKEIKNKFSQIENIEQLAELLRLVYKCLNPEPKKEFLISVKELQYLSIHKDSKYISFSIPKKNGERRPISAPARRLKMYQRLINVLLNVLFEPNKSAFGFVPGKSIVKNAKKHLSKKFVYNIDLENFFPSIKFRRVKSVLGLPPFNLNESKEYIAFIIANICCSKGSLPQGAPTSPTLTNVICQRLDNKLNRLAKEHKATYSRYADDITFSSFHEVFNDEFRSSLNIILAEEKFTVNEKKVRLQSRSERQSVTGIVVNSKSNLSKNYIRRIRFWLYIWEKFGSDKANVRFVNDYNGKFKSVDSINPKSLVFKERFRLEKGTTKYNGRTPEFQKVLDGKLNFLSMVRGKDDLLTLKYRAQFNKLSLPQAKRNEETDKMEIEKIVQVIEMWETNGINNAIELYNSKYES